MSMDARRIAAAMQWIFYPVAIVTLGAFAFAVLNPGSNALERVNGVLMSVEGVFVGVVAAAVSIGVLALLVEFVSRELQGRARRRDLGEVVLQLGGGQGPMRFVLPLLTLPFVVGLNMIVFGGGFAAIEWAEVGVVKYLVVGLFYVIAHFLLVAFTLRALRNRPFFVLTKKGFLYEPGDLSPGLILWSDVAGVKETELMTGNGTLSGPAMAAALVVTLKDPAKYAQTYTPLLRALNAVAMKVVQAQADGTGDMVLAAQDFGDRYGEVKALMERYVGGR